MTGTGFTGLEFQHVAFGARTSGRLIRWAIGIGTWRPLLAATVLWALFGILTIGHTEAIAAGQTKRVIGTVCEGHLNQVCHATTDGTGALVGVTHTSNPAEWSAWMPGTADVCRYGAVILTIGAATVGLISLISPSRRRQRQRRGTIRDGVRHDWNGSHRDARSARKHAKRAGNAHARRRARRAGAGHPVSDPTGLEAMVLKHADPPKTKKEKRAKVKAEKDSRKMEKAELDAEWAAELAAIDKRRNGATPSTQQTAKEGKRVGDAMRRDAGGPARQVDAWRDVIEHPHENGPLPESPPFVAAPSPNNPGATMETYPEAEAIGVIFDTRNRVEADEHIREQARQRDHSRPEPVRFSYCQTCRSEVLGSTCESCNATPSHRGIR